MKKKVIALLLSVILVAGRTEIAPVFASEISGQEAQEAVAVEEAFEEDYNDEADVQFEEEVQFEDELQFEEEQEQFEEEVFVNEDGELTVLGEDDEAGEENESVEIGEESAQIEEVPMQIEEDEPVQVDEESAKTEEEIELDEEEEPALTEAEEDQAEEATEEIQEEVSKVAEQDGSIPQETLTIGCGGWPTSFDFDHDASINVYFEFDPDLYIDYRTEECIVDFTTNTTRCMIYAYGSGEGTIKAVNSDTGEVLKIYNVVIPVGTERVTIQKGGYVWANLPALTGGINWTEIEGVSLTDRGARSFQCSWGYTDPNIYDYLYLNELMIAVKGEKVGDYNVTYYCVSEEHPVCIVTYHVIDNGGGDTPEDPDPETEENVKITCGSSPTALEVDYDADSSVIFDIDSNLEIEYRLEDCVAGYATNTARCLVYAYGAGEGTIKAKDSETGDVIKTFNVVIEPISEIITNCKGNSILTYTPSALYSLNWTESDCLSIELKGSYENMLPWGLINPPAPEYLFLQDYVYLVKGLETGYHTVTYYVSSAEKPFYIAHYRIIDHNFISSGVLKEPTCAEDGILGKECANCRETITEPIPATNVHTWNTDYTVDTEPTYDTEGSESIHCSVCDIVKEGSERAVPRLPKPVSALAISGVENKVYDGQEVTLNLVVIDDETVLEEGVDYTVSYSNNSYVGKAQVTVTGIGHYEGSVSRQFLILPGAPAKVTCKNLADGIKISWEKVEGATSYYVYRDDKLLFRESRLERLDKEVKYECGKKYTYRVIATTKDVGNSTRSRTCKMFRLMPVKITKLSNPSAGKLKVEYDKSPGCYGYVVRYGLKSDMSDASIVSVKGENTLSRVFNGAKKGKTYYVQVRTYMLEYGLRYYSGYCTTQKITIKK